MKRRKLGLILTVFMLINIITGIQIIWPLGMNAAEPPQTEPGATTPVSLTWQPVSTTPVSLTWQSSIFGSSTSANNNINVNPDGSITVASLAQSGKISGNADGIAYYYTQLPTGTAFQISADVHVDSFNNPTVGTPNQISFGLMLRKTVGQNGVTSGHVSNFVAVGALNQNIQYFYRNNEERGSSATIGAITLIPASSAPSGDYKLKLAANAGQCVVSCTNGTVMKTTVVPIAGLYNSGYFNVGLFAARGAKVTYSNVNVVTTASGITLANMPNVGYQNLDLDVSGMTVTASYQNGSLKELSPDEYIITGYDKTALGNQTVTINYAGQSASFNVIVKPLILSGINIAYTPVKTMYYLNDSKLDTLGMVVNASFRTDSSPDIVLVRVFNQSEYNLSGFNSSTPGVKTITVASNNDPNIKTSFDITVNPYDSLSLEIDRWPDKRVYYLGEALTTSGLVMKAIYDGSSVILQPDEYTVGSLDTSSPGQKTVIISHKGVTAELSLTVQANKLNGISITQWPVKTTFTTGEAIDWTGLVVSKVYDNGDKTVLAPTGYKVDSSKFNSTSPGAYDIWINPVDTSISPISFKVTVRAPETYHWNSVFFGQSIDETANFVTPSAIDTISGTITVSAIISSGATTGGGKVTGAHDGISYYYTVIDPVEDNFVLSADVKVIEFAKQTPDNQEAFGLMARDAIGGNWDSSVFSSNVAAVGGYRGLTNAFMRTGVTNSAGNEGTIMTATNWNTQRPGLSNTYPNATYRLRLAKTNTGFEVSLNGAAATSSLFYSPDDFNSQDPHHLYIGFYAARVATIEVSNVSFSVSAAETDAPRVQQPQTPIVPSMGIVSLPYASKTDYALQFTSNVNGKATIKQGANVIANNVTVSALQVFTQNTVIAENSDTNFSVVLTPDASQFLTSYNRIFSNFTVTMKTYGAPDGAIYVSPSGTSSGKATIEDPLDLDTAIRFVKEGQTIYMLGGTYKRKTPVTIAMGNNGTAAGIKTLAACNSEPVIIDFGSSSQGFQLGGNYWHIKGLNTTKAASTGFLVGGSNNIVERCSTYVNGDTGMQISRFVPTLSRESWPVNNLILNCESYDNRDAAENNADGFAAKLTCGTGNVFRGCIAHNNIDDGWDLYTKAETGAIGEVLIEDCIAYDNGTLTNGRVGAGDKNGFKLGGEGIAVANVIRNSLSFGNGAAGFTSNSNPAAQAYNCISYNNTGGNFVFTTFNSKTPQFVMDHVVSYRSTPGANDNYPSSARNADNYFSNGSASDNSNGVRLVDGNFVSLTPNLPYERDAKGNIIRGDFLKFISPSDATLKGITVNKGKLTPAFSPEVKKYVVYVDNNVKDITITSAAFSALAGSLKVNNTALTSGAAYTLRLEKGDNYVTLVVTAQDGTTKGVYVVNVFKEHDNRKIDMDKRMKEIWDAMEDFWKSISN